MKILTDLHTHTIASTHAYSTIKENVDVALERKLQILAITDHCSLLSDSPHNWHFTCQKALPRYIEGMMLLFGVECNLSDTEGTLDLSNSIIKNLDIVIASVHTPVLNIQSEQHYTEVLLGAISNPYIDILGHIGRCRYGFDYDTVIKAAKSSGKLIEINNHTLDNTMKGINYCEEILLSCKSNEAGIVVNSDAHSCYGVGDLSCAIELLQKNNFPEHLIINRTKDTFMQYLNNRERGFEL